MQFPPTAVIFMGVSGCGKSTALAALHALLPPALRASTRQIEADDLHPPTNRAKMAAGIPLTDADRWPWLATVAASIVDVLSVVPTSFTTTPILALAACSALRQSYRVFLGRTITEAVVGARVVFVWMDVPADDLLARLERRQLHFMKANMLGSQLRTLENPVADSDANGSYTVIRVVCSTDDSPSDVADCVRDQLFPVLGL
ncbi:P-loop containing nucleoside triphosphate hydrolase protein [Blastocladiella britannica]|nr:P-loop containing nucleoside triphosphate hydrolase protein [Blastocladiella britannica]